MTNFSLLRRATSIHYFTNFEVRNWVNELSDVQKVSRDPFVTANTSVARSSRKSPFTSVTESSMRHT
jgi:hypothetical protein